MDSESLEPEVVHPIGPTLSSASPHGTPTRLMLGTPGGDGPSFQGVGGSEVVSEREEVVTSDRTRGKRGWRGKRAGGRKRRARAKEMREEGSGTD